MIFEIILPISFINKIEVKKSLRVLRMEQIGVLE